MFPNPNGPVDPDKPAVIMAATGRTVTYGQLEQRSNQLARLWFDQGLRRGDHVALLAENVPEYLEIYWAAIRSGLHLTCVNRYLSADEASYIINDCAARSLIVTSNLSETAAALIDLVPQVESGYCIGASIAGYSSYEAALAVQPPTQLPEQPRGELMLYSSGTTGRPKGVARALSGASVFESTPFMGMVQHLFSIDEQTVYLSPAPLYHAAPIGYCGAVTALGGTVIVMERFESATALSAIETYGVTHSQWVPTMFVRMLKEPADLRTKYDLSTLQCAIHAAAPCPVEVKREMIEWWGPILNEYYAGTEGNGLTFINSEQWLQHPGSVGRAMLGIVHICDDEGRELPTGVPGVIYFERDAMPFEYHGDSEKTRSAQHPTHPTWTALGDVGYLDEEGFLYLTDRRSYMIISGGVNIYPQEIEDRLILHSKVLDAAVFGLPDPEMGEFVQAVVEVAPSVAADDALRAELLEHLRVNLARFKVPRRMDFTDQLPRLPTGKLYKDKLRNSYLADLADQDQPVG